MKKTGKKLKTKRKESQNMRRINKSGRIKKHGRKVQREIWEVKPWRQRPMVSEVNLHVWNVLEEVRRETKDEA